MVKPASIKKEAVNLSACRKEEYSRTKVEKFMPEIPEPENQQQTATQHIVEKTAAAGAADAAVEQLSEKKKKADAAGSSVSSSLSISQKFLQRWSGGHSKREWLLLGERVFSHPRYAVLIIVALGLCFFERYWFVIAPLALFFAVEWTMRFWLQKENRWRNKSELLFLFFDGVATLSMVFVLLMPLPILDQGIYLRIARLLRGMYMLRMLRIFRFLTFDTIVFSLPFSLSMIGLAALAWVMPSTALFIGVVLIIETGYRAYSLVRLLPNGKRRNLDLAFIVPDMIAAFSLFEVVPFLSSSWVALRVIRFVIMLNPLGNILLAVKNVMAEPEVRQEGSMLAAMFAGFMIVGSIAVWYAYPQLDINEDGATNNSDYGPFQVILYVFRVMVDPGAAPTEAFTPLLTGLTVMLVLSGVFFFALVVSLGSNVMRFMLEELANSPLSAREHILFVGWNEQALPILNKVGELAGRMRDSFPSVWIFHEKAALGAAQVGNWLNIRVVKSGTRDLIKRFKLSGISQLIIFKHRHDETNIAKTADIHHLARELGTDGLVISEKQMPENLSTVYQESLGLNVIDSASIRARMLYQMHHCSHMPELGSYMFDVISGETGLYSIHWDFEIRRTSAGAEIHHQNQHMLLEPWLSNCFGEGLNLLGARREDGSYILFSDLIKHSRNESFSSVVALGRDQLLWPGIMSHAFSLGESKHVNPLQTFTWPETWDLSMMFLGWHPGLPAMIEEMADRHHKLTVHVFSTDNESLLEKHRRELSRIEVKVNEAKICVLKIVVHSWDGLDTEQLVSQLKGCKVMMLYPESNENSNEDSMLELWLHEVASMLTSRKNKVKWWTPPKLMVLPRDGNNIGSLVEASLDYPLLDVRVGSPDAFHDVFMARQLLTQARKSQYPDEAVMDVYTYEFMDAMLGDAVLVEDVETKQLLEQGVQSGWESVYREALRRGWILMAYLDHERSHSERTAFSMLDRAFPLDAGHAGSMQILGGAPVLEMHAPHQTASLLFCRRGVLNNEESEVETSVEKAAETVAKAPVVKKEVIETAVEAAAAQQQPVKEVVKEMEPEQAFAAVSEDVSVVQPVVEVSEHIETAIAKAEAAEVPAQEEVAEAIELVDESSKEELSGSTALVEREVVEGEVMGESVWPKQADKRLLRVLEKQVEGSVELLGASSEGGLMKLMEILEMGVSPEVEAKLMDALTDLQNIDRVSQRMNNVKTCLSEWAESRPDATEAAVWEEEVAKRYVMEEERLVLRGEL